MQQEELERRIREGMGRLSQNLQDWFSAHVSKPEPIVAHSDPETDSPVQLVKLTSSTGQNDSSYIVVFNETRNIFGLVARLDGGRLWYLGDYGELDDAVKSI